ncbi:MAG: methyltransferase domain-containing protein, partial [Bdellovibrionales bacterium]|nr:methyltransferase domain-containing protein [Bdellovibrionales bacterium]
LLLELVHNSLDEALMGFADRIGVRIGSDYLEVQDNGRGISTEIHPTEGLPDCEVALTRLHAGSKFNKAPNEFTAGLHGVGLSCVNALSSNLKITIDRNGQRFEQEYAKGVTCSPLRRLGQMHTTGTTVRFWPDVSIFKNFVSLNKEDCRQVLQVLAWLHPEVEFSFFDDERGVSESFANQGGVEKILEMDIKSKRCLFLPPVNIELSGDSFKMNALFVWTTESDTSIRSYVNGIHTTHGGTHVNAFKAGISRAVHQMARQFDGGAVSSNSYFELNEIIEGLVAVVICQLSQPNFEGQTKTRLTNANIGEILEIETAKKLTQYFSEHPHESKVLFERMRQSRNVRASVRRIADRIFLQNNQLKINEEVYKAQFGARSRNWHSSAVWITDSALLEKHAEQCEVGEGALALDVCCGSGVVGASFKSKVSKVIGLDLTPEMVALARERLDEVHQGNVYQLPFADNKFDLVCTREVLHLLPYPEKPVSEIWRVMKPGGQFVVGQILPFGADDAGSTLLGLELRIKRGLDNDEFGISDYVFHFTTDPGAVSLSVVGSDFASGASWNSCYDDYQFTYYNTDPDIILGGITLSDLLDPNFAVALKVTNVTGTRTAVIDCCELRVHYEPPTGPYLNSVSDGEVLHGET